jgi:hypothetical protein
MAAQIIKGEDILLQIVIRDLNNNPYDLTDKTVTVKTKIGPTLTTFSSPDVTVVNPVFGSISLKLSDTVTESLAVGDFNIDVYLQEGTDTRIVEIYKKAKVIDRLR